MPWSTRVPSEERPHPDLWESWSCLIQQCECWIILVANCKQGISCTVLDLKSGLISWNESFFATKHISTNHAPLANNQYWRIMPLHSALERQHLLDITPRHPSLRSGFLSYLSDVCWTRLTARDSRRFSRSWLSFQMSSDDRPIANSKFSKAKFLSPGVDAFSAFGSREQSKSEGDAEEKCCTTRQWPQFLYLLRLPSEK